MRKSLKLYMLVVVNAYILLFNSCKTDPYIPLDGGGACIEMPSSPAGLGLGWSTRVLNGFVRYPTFNPNNSDEIVFENGYISTYNCSTNVQDIIFKEAAVFPVWTLNNWIYFTRYLDGQIWKMRPNGSNLTQVTTRSNFQNYYLVASKENDMLIFTSFSKTDKKRAYILNTKTDIIVDSIMDIDVNLCSFNDSKLWAALSYNGLVGIFEVDIHTKERKFIFPKDEIRGIGTVNGICKYGDDIIYADRKGVYKYNLINKKIKLMKPCCDSRLYLYPNISNNELIVYAKHISKATSDYTATIEYQIVTTDLNGMNEKVVLK